MWNIGTVFQIQIWLDCECDPYGSSSPQCQSDGSCFCKTGYFGQKCNEISKPKSKRTSKCYKEIIS